MAVIKGILSFNDLFVPKRINNNPGSAAKFQAVILLPPGDPQIQQIEQEYQLALAEGFGGILPHGAKSCWTLYEDRYRGKDYYDPKFNGCMVLSTTAAEDQPPHVVGADRQPITNKGATELQAGHYVWINFSMSKYEQGGGTGIGGWLNGIMTTGELGPFGSLSNKPSAEAMFAGVAGGPGPVGGSSAPASPAAPAGPGPAAPAAPSAPAAPAAPAGPVMTDKAEFTYEQYITAGWNDQQLITNGLMMPVSFQ